MWVHFVLSEPVLWPRRTLCTSWVDFVLSAPHRLAEQDEMHPEQRIIAVAGRQHGAISVGQLLEAGLSHRAIAHRVKRGWLLRLHRGVYLVGPLEAPLSRAMAAVLAVGPGAVLSHRSAAAVWELLPPASGPIDVTLPGREARHRTGIRVHESSGIDATCHRHVPITTPAQTLHNIAPTLPTRDLARATEQAEIRGLVTHDELTHFLTSRRSSPGAKAFRAVLDPHIQLTRSEAERRFLDLIDQARLPVPAANTRAGGYEVDFLWPAQRLIVEVDGFAFHRSRAAFERDRARDAHLGTLGYRVIRITWRQLVEEPSAVAATIAAALAGAAAVLPA